MNLPSLDEQSRRSSSVCEDLAVAGYCRIFTNREAPFEVGEVARLAVVGTATSLLEDGLLNAVLTIMTAAFSPRTA